MGHFVEGNFKGYKVAPTYAGNGGIIPAGTAVKLDADRNIVPAASATDKIIGVLNADAKAGWETDVHLRTAAGTLNIKLAGTVAIGDAVTSDASGLGVTTVTAGNQIIGYAAEAGVAGRVIELFPSMAKV